MLLAGDVLLHGFIAEGVACCCINGAWPVTLPKSTTGDLLGPPFDDAIKTKHTIWKQ